MHRRAWKTQRLTIQLDIDELPKPKQTKKEMRKALRAKREQQKREEEEQIKEEVDRVRHAGCLCAGHRVFGCSYGWANCDQCRAKIANLALGNIRI